MKITECVTKLIIEDIKEEEKESLIKSLNKSLAVWDPAYFKYVNQIYKYDEENNKIFIPGSYSNTEFEKIFGKDILIQNNIENQITKRNMGRVNLKSAPRDNLQQNAIKFLKGETYSKDCNQKLLSLKTGEGKTYCAINFSVSTKTIPIIFVDQLSLAEQWKKAILQFTSVEEDQIFIISGKDKFTKLEKKNKKEISSIKFFICIHKTISAYLEENFYKANEFFNRLGIGIKIFDEAHLSVNSMFNIDYAIDCPSIYLTATPSRSDKNENYVYKRAIKEMKVFSTEKGIFKKESYHNILLVKFNSNPSYKDSLKFKNKYGFSINGYNQYMEKEDKYDYFLDKIVRLIKFGNKGGKNRRMAIILHSLSIVEKVNNDLQKIFSDKKIGRFDGTISKEEKSNVLENCDIIVTTDMSFSKGIDVKNLEIVINTVPIYSAPKNEQMLGRLRELPGKEVWYFDFVDAGLSNMQSILKAKESVYMRKAKFIKDVVLK